MKHITIPMSPQLFSGKVAAVSFVRVMIKASSHLHKTRSYYHCSIVITYVIDNTHPAYCACITKKVSMIPLCISGCVTAEVLKAICASKQPSLFSVCPPLFSRMIEQEALLYPGRPACVLETITDYYTYFHRRKGK
jgi:hypothetical protein